jgi:hypothetical protein
MELNNMTNKPQVKIVNAETGEEIIRDANAEELAQMKIDEADSLARQAKAEAEVSAKAALAAAKQAAQDKLKGLGLTDLEIAAITGA